MRFLILFVLGVCATQATAQAISPTRLGQPTVTYGEPFSRLVGLRELTDGRVVISDDLEKTVGILDLASGELSKVGREGQGPGEYVMPGSLFALPGDSTLLVDFGNFRGLKIGSDGSLGGTVPFRNEGGTGLFFPRTADRAGRLYTAASISFGPGGAQPGDSLPLLRLDLKTDKVDTVAYLENPASLFVSRGGGGPTLRTAGGSSVSMGARQPYRAADAWVVSPDGRIAFVRAADYHVEWLTPGRRPVVGPKIPYTPVKVGKAEKEEYVNSSNQGMRMVVSGGSGGGTRTISPPKPKIEDLDWPDVKPAFETAVAAPNGYVWIRVSQPAGAKAATYDVVDSEGKRVARVELPAGRRLAAFGAKLVYLVNKDADDLEWLEAYTLPANLRES